MDHLSPLPPPLVRRRDALAAGRTPAELRALLDSGRWTAVRRGIYAPTPELTDPERPGLRHWIEAVALQDHLDRPTAAFSHSTAARFLGLRRGGSPRLEQRLTDPYVWRRGRGFRVSHAALHPDEVITRGRLRLTSPARTLLDCVRESSALDAVAALDHGLLTRRVDRAALQAVVDRSPSRPGTPAALRALALADGRSESWLESAWRVRHLAAGLPAPQLQVQIWVDDRLVKVVDGWFPRAALAVECDGRVKYERPYRGRSPAQVLWEEKLAEDALRAVGIRVVRVVHDDVVRGWGALVARTRRELAAPPPSLQPFRTVPRTVGLLRPS